MIYRIYTNSHAFRIESEMNSELLLKFVEQEKWAVFKVPERFPIIIRSSQICAIEQMAPDARPIVKSR